MARLDKYLAKLNGAAGSVPAPVSSLDREMDELAKNPPSGGGLPEVTAADNGDVLTVVDGEWGKAAPSGGGYSVQRTAETVIAEQTVTTSQMALGYAATVTGSIAGLEKGSYVDVTFNGTKYSAPVTEVNVGGGNVPAIGEASGSTFDFSTFPFFFMEGGGICRVLTETAATVTVKIESVEITVEYTDDFAAAVNAVLADNDN